jgi:DNA/RNA-binding domain of Phe-tRNA-synthetase-like protein
MIEFSVDPAVADFVSPAVLAADALTIVAGDARLHEAMAATERALRAACEIGHTVVAVRAMYRRFGVDPTKTRPSSEALLRRLRKGESLPRINSLVDLGNWCSAETQLPYGLYDLARISGPVTLRLGRDGEEYAGIRKDTIHVAGRLTLADQEGPFGNPTADSARTMVTCATERALIVVFTPADLAVRLAPDALELTASRVREYTGGRITGRQLFDRTRVMPGVSVPGGEP